MIEIALSLCTLAGAIFVFIGALGINRLQDFYLRIHVLSKSATLGITLLILASIFALDEWDFGSKALISLFFLGLTIPMGAHFLTRAALHRRMRPMCPLSPNEYDPSEDRRD